LAHIVTDPNLPTQKLTGNCGFNLMYFNGLKMTT